MIPNRRESCENACHGSKEFTLNKTNEEIAQGEMIYWTDLLVEAILTRRMENRNAHLAIVINYRNKMKPES